MIARFGGWEGWGDGGFAGRVGGCRGPAAAERVAWGAARGGRGGWHPAPASWGSPFIWMLWEIVVSRGRGMAPPSRARTPPQVPRLTTRAGCQRSMAYCVEPAAATLP